MTDSQIREIQRLVDVQVQLSIKSEIAVIEVITAKNNLNRYLYDILNEKFRQT